MIEFSEYVPGLLIIIMCIAYPVVAFVIYKEVRKGIKNEMEQLQWLSEYHKARDL